MPVVSHEVTPLFVEPFFRANIAGSTTPAQIAYVQGLKMVRNMENLISENLYIFEEPELKVSSTPCKRCSTYMRGR